VDPRTAGWLDTAFSCTASLRLFGCCFFQAEDGIRDATVTGVQTCALPIFIPGAGTQHTGEALLDWNFGKKVTLSAMGQYERWTRSEERRVGKECRSRWGRGR